MKNMKAKLLHKNELQKYLNQTKDYTANTLMDAFVLNDFSKVEIEDIKKYITLGLRIFFLYLDREIYLNQDVY